MSTSTPAAKTKKAPPKSKSAGATAGKATAKKPGAKKAVGKKAATPAKKATAPKPKKAAAPKKAAPKKAALKKAAPKKVAPKKAAPKKVAAKPAAAKKKAAPSPSLASQAKQAADVAATGQLVNHIAFVVDRSGSMSSIRKKVVQVFNDQLGSLKKKAAETGQATFVSFYTFQSVVDKPKFFAKPIDQVDALSSISCTGLTALFDATGQAIVDLESVPGADQQNVSFFILVLTDGHENHSKKYKSAIKTMIQKAQASGRWTFAFLTPKGGAAVLTKFGIPEGNIRAWTTTSAGMKQLDQTLQQGLQNFYTARSQGQKAVAGVFTTDLTGVSTDKVKETLSEATDGFEKLSVTADTAINALVDKHLGKKGAYKKGDGYYELTKPELMQELKEVAIVEKASGKIYVGDAARTLLGLPIGERIKIKPGDHAQFAIFVQSTSLNRKLLAGTTLLYRKS